MKHYGWVLAIAGLTAAGAVVRATETENLGLRLLPVPGAVVIDGKIDDWDLSGGVFACADCETQRDQYALWFHAMYDQNNLYVLARWVDPTPLNNPFSSKGDLAFNGDCLQFRIVGPGDRCSHWTCYRDRDGVDLMDLTYGRNFKEGHVRDARTQGAAQAFSVESGAGQARGYVQEIAIPWTLLSQDGKPAPKAGDQIVLTIEPNFTIGNEGRLTVKDIFRSGVKVDRIFTFMSSQVWGTATLEVKGHVAPAPVRLSDNREFAVTLANGMPQIDWTGLIKSRELTGFKPVPFTMPVDGYISVIIKDADGVVVRHLLNNAFFTKGPHEVKWDGTTDPVFRTPGNPVPAGTYTYSAIFHTGLGLKLRGVASCDGRVPWDDGPTSGWGGDHGLPVAAAAAGKRVYLGWSGAEAGKALLACDLQGNVLWRNTRGGIGAATLIAVDQNTVYTLNNNSLYRVTADKGGYTFWAGTESADLALSSLVEKAGSAQGLAARDGKLYLSFAKYNAVVMVDGLSGKVLKRMEVPAPGRIALMADGRLLVVSDGTAVLSLDVQTGMTTPVISGLQKASALAVDAEGRLYVGSGDNQVHVFSAEGKPVREIGIKGGRRIVGPWQREGLAFIAGITVDGEGKLWVMEAHEQPKRVSVWDTKTGKCLKEFFGPTHYGASGGAINPEDPDIMVGEGCEWRLDPVTGRSVCTGVIEQRCAGFARFCTPANKRLYLALSQGMGQPSDYRIYERVGEGSYKLRAAIVASPSEKGKKAAGKRFTIWSDENGDEQRQEGEVTTLDGEFSASGYIGVSEYVNTDLSICCRLTQDGKGRTLRLVPVGFTACGAPRYDVAKAEPIPAAGLPSLDNRFLVEWTPGKIKGYELSSGKLRWTYPNTFSGVHESHLAPAPEMGLLRGSFGVVGSAILPKPVGAVWALNGNSGEWYVFTEEGFFLAQLFQGDPMKVQWPAKAEPGAILDHCPPGLGGEDFGGSMVQAKDGRVFLQVGKIGLWNVELTGLDTIGAVKGGRLVMGEDDVKTALGYRERALQQVTGGQRIKVERLTPVFTGNPGKDFPGVSLVSFKKQDEAGVRAAAAWDDHTLFLVWEVEDSTPWVNGATDPAQMYIGGDTVDFQLGTNPKANPKRSEAGLGDLRLSIGPAGGKGNKAMAVLYRRVSTTKNPRVFSSGVVKEYPMDYVDVVADVKTRVTIKPGKGYVVEAAVPMAVLGVTPVKGLVLRGDLGVTHGDPAGQRTRLRTYLSNQQTGLVDDAVFELQLAPANWGELEFK